MITRVRIAPYEQWCELGKKLAPEELKARIGQFVTIDSDSMQIHTDDNGVTFRNWALVGDDLFWLQLILRDPFTNGLCEHLLEID